MHRTIMNATERTAMIVSLPGSHPAWSQAQPRPGTLHAEAAAALFQVITQRHFKGSIALTTNLGIASWGRIFDDPMVAAAMLDRLLHRSVVFNITGESYRMRTHRARADKLRSGIKATP